MDSLIINNIDQIPTPADTLRVVISGGGTGGHINPALSIAQAIIAREPKAQILFVGALGRMEMERVPKAGYPIIGLPVRGLDRKRPWRNFGVILDFLRARRRCRKILDRFKPQVVVGVGGYASAPILKAAQGKGIPTILQEQNSYAGVTNKLLASGADRICVAYDGMERFFPAGKIEITGNPVRKSLEENKLSRSEAKQKLGFSPDRPLLFVTGGSLGARTINESIAASLDNLAESGVQLLWQTGRYGADTFQGLARGREGVKAVTFVDDMATAYRAADLIVARAGACTISEIQNLGLPAVLIPSPNVAEDHQRHNAEALANRDAAVMVFDADAVRTLPTLIPELIRDREKCEKMGQQAAEMAHRGADDRIAAIIMEILNSKA